MIEARDYAPPTWLRGPHVQSASRRSAAQLSFLDNEHAALHDESRGSKHPLGVRVRHVDGDVRIGTNA